MEKDFEFQSKETKLILIALRNHIADMRSGRIPGYASESSKIFQVIQFLEGAHTIIPSKLPKTILRQLKQSCSHAIGSANRQIEAVKGTGVTRMWVDQLKAYETICQKLKELEETE